jgi:hypothetical protein
MRAKGILMRKAISILFVTAGLLQLARIRPGSVLMANTGRTVEWRHANSRWGPQLFESVECFTNRKQEADQIAGFWADHGQAGSNPKVRLADLEFHAKIAK